MHSDNDNNQDDATVINTGKVDQESTVLANHERQSNAASAPVQEDETVLVAPVLETEENDEATRLAATKPLASTSAEQSLRIGSILKNRFVLREVLGAGGMGTVYQATDLRREEAKDTQTDVAIKVLNDEFKDDPELLIALQRETKKSQMLAHPNIVTVYDFDRDGSNVFMVMELLKGQSLSQFIREKHPSGLRYADALPIIKGMCSALQYAHKKNIIHSDFKPGNVFITDKGEAKVLDFGIACAARGDANEDKVFDARNLGGLTPAYASLEMLLGKAPDPADDVYALGCVCFQLLSGKHPYGRLTAQKAMEVNAAIPKVAGLNRRQRLVLKNALAFERDNRIATVDQFIQQLMPPLLWPKVLVAVMLVLVVGSGIGYFYVFNELEVVDEKIIQLSEEEQLAVKDFLVLASIHFEVGYLTAPSGSNAMWAYRQVLELEPYNKEAQNGLNKIADIMQEQAASLLQEKQYKASLSKIEEGLAAVPKHKQLLKLKKRLQQEVLLDE